MTYKDTLNAVDSDKALELLEIEYQSQGAYLKFKCPNECQGTAVLKAYGDKKNLYYCPTCKSSGHIISLAMKVRGIDWQEASELLSKAIGANAKKLTEALTIKYELLYKDFIKEKGISEAICQHLEIGVPKGKTMLAGSVAFAVRDEAGTRIAYYGIKMKDGKPIFHKTFNPEFYLYNFCNLVMQDSTYFTTDMFKCVRLIEEGKQCICNFGLPYLSPSHLELLDNIDNLVFMIDEPLVKSFAITLAENHRGFYRFDH